MFDGVVHFDARMGGLGFAFKKSMVKVFQTGCSSGAQGHDADAALLCKLGCLH